MHICRFGFVAALATLLLTASVVAQTPDQSFTAMADQIWEFRLSRDPILATSTGDHRYNDRLPVVSVANSQAELAAFQQFRRLLQQIPRVELTARNRVNYDIVVRTLETQIAESEFRAYLIPITNREGFHISFPELRRLMPLKTVKDHEDYIARLKGFQNYAGEHIQVMRQGLAEGYSLPSVVLQQYREPIETHIVKDAATSVFFEPFNELPDAIPEIERARLRDEARQAIEAGIVPGYSDFLKFMEQEYVPGARGSLGASALPQGREFYRHRVRRFTTLEISPEEVHQIGLAEVKRIRTEMEAVAREAAYPGDLAGFMKFLRTDQQFQPKSADQLMKEAALILKRMDGQLPILFKTLPRTPYGLQQIPAYIAPQTTAAYYMPPPGDGSRAGFYFLNTYDLSSRPLYNLQALSLHEAVPGHHLQLALQQELRGLPNYRRFATFTAFIEGWALYAERLGLEVGFYEDPYSNFGRLTYEMWRACRLVVDTGIHYLGWTRQQAIDFMADNTALSLHNIRSEVDRYIAWPGQALGYKIGEIKIRELRQRSEEELRDKFDLREFHDAVLMQGSVPLDVLTQQVEAWIAKVKASPNN